jgi:hypothetical protein
MMPDRSHPAAYSSTAALFSHAKQSQGQQLHAKDIHGKQLVQVQSLEARHADHDPKVPAQPCHMAAYCNRYSQIQSHINLAALTFKSRHYPPATAGSHCSGSVCTQL